MNKILTLQEAVDYSGITEKELLDMVKEKKLHAISNESNVFFESKSIERIIVNLKEDKINNRVLKTIKNKDMNYHKSNTFFYSSPNGDKITDIKQIKKLKYVWVKTEERILLYVKPLVTLQDEFYSVSGRHYRWLMDIAEIW